MNCLNFYSWMMHNHLQDDSPIGRLAKDMKSDRRQFVRTTRYSRNRVFLEINHASDKCLEAFEEAWKEYEIYKRGIYDARKNR